MAKARNKIPRKFYADAHKRLSHIVEVLKRKGHELTFADDVLTYVKGCGQRRAGQRA